MGGNIDDEKCETDATRFHEMWVMRIFARRFVRSGWTTGEE